MTGRELQEFFRMVHCRVDYEALSTFYRDLLNMGYLEQFFLDKKWEKFTESLPRWFMELDGSAADFFVEFVNQLT